MKNTWKDATNYSRYDTERKQDAWELSTGQLRIWISTGHIHYKGAWVITCHELGISAVEMKISADATHEMAQDLAVRIVKNRLEIMLKSLE